MAGLWKASSSFCQVDIWLVVALMRASEILPEQRRSKCLAASRQNLKLVALFSGVNWTKLL